MTSLYFSGPTLQYTIRKAADFYSLPEREIQYTIENETPLSFLIKTTNTIPESKAGKFTISYKKGYAVLTVYPPGKKGKPVYPDEITNKMKILEIPWVRTLKLQEIIDKADGSSINLVEWPEGKKLISHIEISISEDEMEAYLTITPPKKGGGHPEYDDITTALFEAGVTYGIDIGEIQKLINQKQYNTRITAAKGTPPVNPQHTHIKYHFPTERLKPWLSGPYGRINLKELNFIHNVKENDLLASLKPGHAGKPGKTVTGKPLSPRDPLPPETLVPGPNTYLSKNQEELFASIPGNVIFRNGRVEVEPVIQLQNVNYETGNIHFTGSVIINGTIADGFTVEATGTIQIEECVGKVNITAGKELILKSGIYGNQEGKIHAGEDIFVKFIESATVVTDGNLIVEEAIMHSKITAAGNVLLSGKRAEIIGGHLFAGGSIWCKKLGNIYNNETVISAGVQPKVYHTYHSLLERIGEKKETLSKIDTALIQLNNSLSSEDAQVKEINDKISQLENARISLENEIDSLNKDLHDKKILLYPNMKSKIIVEDIAYNGVFITFGSAEFAVNAQNIKKVIFKFRNGTVVQSGFNPLEPPGLDQGSQDENS